MIFPDFSSPETHLGHPSVRGRRNPCLASPPKSSYDQCDDFIGATMLPFLLFAQAVPPPQEIVVPQTVRALPGKLDQIPVFNSNQPELVQEEGILLSTFPPEGKQVPSAHLNLPFAGRFDVFAHHIARAKTPDDLRTLYLGVVLYNPGNQPITVDVLQAASYLSQPDAPFIDLPPTVDNPRNTVYSGPGSRAMSDVLRGQRQAVFPAQIVIPPGQSQMLMNLPIPVRLLTPPLNGRSTLIRLWSSGPVYAASLAMFAKLNPAGNERAPDLEEWVALLNTGDRAGPPDVMASPPNQTTGAFSYGRVAGVSVGSEWRTQVVDASATAANWYLTIPPAGEAFAYGLSTLLRGSLGTGQIQSAPMLAYYPETAFAAHGNYAVEYRLTLPLKNTSSQTQTVAIAFETPIKEDQLSKPGLRFFTTPARQVFFRGTVRIRFTDDRGLPQTRYVHLVQRRGQRGEALALMTLKPGDQRLVQFDFLYPPDATPPQILTVRTIKPKP